MQKRLKTVKNYFIASYFEESGRNKFDILFFMIKEFEINEILNAVNSISKIEKKKTKTVEKKDLGNKDDVLTLNNQAKSNKSEILVLDQMIE